MILQIIPQRPIWGGVGGGNGTPRFHNGKTKTNLFALDVLFYIRYIETQIETLF